MFVRRLGRLNQIWLRGLDLNQRPSGYEPDELPGCSTPRQVEGECTQGGPRVKRFCSELVTLLRSCPGHRRSARKLLAARRRYSFIASHGFHRVLPKAEDHGAAPRTSLDCRALIARPLSAARKASGSRIGRTHKPALRRPMRCRTPSSALLRCRPARCALGSDACARSPAASRVNGLRSHTAPRAAELREIRS